MTAKAASYYDDKQTYIPAKADAVIQVRDRPENRSWQNYPWLL
jgi:hypothetical protein